MNEKEKQIEEMATDVCRCLVWDQDGYATVDCLITAKNLHHIGYRKQRVGEWIRVAAFNDGVLNTVKCSACGVYQPLGCWDYHSYCPRCGAKMGGGAE